MTRTYYLDEVCGLLIIHMILSHIFAFCGRMGNIIYITETNLFFFFMPWFCYKSGMFFKKKSMNMCIKSSINNLLKPFIFFVLLGILCNFFILLIQNDDKIIVHTFLSPLKQILIQGHTWSNAPVWFLLSLFTTKIVYNYFFLKFRYNIHIIILFLMIISTIVESYNLVFIPIYINNTLINICFYHVGFVLKNKQFNTYIIFLSLVILFIQYNYIFSYVDMRTGRTIEGNFILWHISSIAGIIIINYIFKKKKFHIISLEIIGQQSINYLGFHWLIMTVTKALFERFSFNIAYLFIMILVLNIIMLPIISQIMTSKRIVQQCFNCINKSTC